MMTRTIAATLLLWVAGSGVVDASESYKPSTSSVKQRAEQIYQKIWQANADLFKGRKKPKFYFSSRKVRERVHGGKKASIAGRAQNRSIIIYEQACLDSDKACAHVIAHELAHIYRPPQRGGLIRLLNGCEFKVPDFELMADAIGRKMAMRAGFNGVMGSYERACNVTAYFSADMARTRQTSSSGDTTR